MPIKVACKCGKQFLAKDSLAGSQVKCPNCGSGILVGSAPVAVSPLADLVTEAGVEESNAPQCPNCKSELKTGAMLCVACGYDLKSGKQIKANREKDPDEEIDFSKLRRHGNKMLDEAERNILRNSLQEKRMERGAPWWVFLIGVSICVGFVAVAAVYEPNALFMAIFTFSTLSVFLISSVMLTLTCNFYSSLEKKFLQTLKASQELTPPAIGYSMGILIAYVALETGLMAAASPMFGLRWWEGVNGKEDIPTAWGFYFIMAVTSYAALVYACAMMIPTSWKRSALIVLMFSGIMSVFGGFFYLLYYLLFS